MQYLIKNNKIIQNVLLLVFSPIIMISFNVVVVTIFNIGTYLGTFLRALYHLVVC